jgi:hypothetical protein
MDEKIELTQKAVRKSVGQETAFVNMLNDEMEMLILSLGYRKEIDTAREILKELWDETEPTENDEWVREKIKEIAKRKGVEVE